MSAYHRQTAYQRQGMGGHALDWGNQPEPFKEYPGQPPLPLASPRPPAAGFWALALAWPPPAAQPPAPLDAASLAAALLLAAGLTTRDHQRTGLPGLRAQASAGALYPAELYLASCQVPGVEDGLHHFAPQAPGLAPLWPGAHAGYLAGLLGASPSALTFIITAIYWRSLWKYRTRAYRYCLLDAGHLLANLELALAALGLAPATQLDFPDRSLGVFLGLASQDEAPLAVVSAGPVPDQPGPPSHGLPPLDRQALPLSARVGRDPQVVAAHEQGALEAPAAPRLWPTVRVESDLISLPQPPAEGPSLLACVRKRRSRRNFVSQGLGADQVAGLLAAALPEPGPCQAMVLLGPGGRLDPGLYLHLPEEKALAPLRAASDYRRELAGACLGQMWLAQADFILVLWADLDLLQERGGPRTYRHAMLAAGRAGQRLYLAATALGLGCCGVGAFYDQEVALLAGLPAQAQPLYVLACGPVKGGLP